MFRYFSVFRNLSFNFVQEAIFMKRATLLFLLICSVSSIAQNRAVTLEKLLSAPFPSEISAAPTTARVAWIQNERGMSNLFVADAPEYRARQLTKYSKDDGQMCPRSRGRMMRKRLCLCAAMPPIAQAKIRIRPATPAAQNRRCGELPLMEVIQSELVLAVIQPFHHAAVNWCFCAEGKSIRLH